MWRGFFYGVGIYIPSDTTCIWYLAHEPNGDVLSSPQEASIVYKIDIDEESVVPHEHTDPNDQFMQH